MLSRIGRSALRRAGAGAAHRSTSRAFQGVWHLQRLSASENRESALSSTRCFFILRRSLATAAKKTTSTTTKRKATKKPAKKKAAAKPKRKVKAKPKKKVKTPEQEQKLKIKNLKMVALDEPKGKPSTAWTVLLSQYMKENAAPGNSIATLSKDAAAKYKALSPGELEVS